MMPRSIRIGAIAISALAASSGVVVASVPLGGTPIAGSRLVYRDRGTPQKSVLAFVSSDPDIPVPAAGVADVSQSGLSIYIATRVETLHLRIPGGLGNPGWKVRTGDPDTYVYRGPSVGQADAVKLVWREGGPLKLRVRGVRLENAPPYEGMSIRIDSLWTSNCAVFTGSAIQLDRQGVFSGRNAPSDAVDDCDDATIANGFIECGLSAPQCGGYCPDGGKCGDIGTEECVCVSPHQPCGNSWPVCNGECALGETCFIVNEQLFTECVCAPSDERPCGGGGSYCPSGSTCKYVPYRFGLGSHHCIDDDAVCGPGLGHCPPGFVCGPFGIPGWDFTYTCYP